VDSQRRVYPSDLSKKQADGSNSGGDLFDKGSEFGLDEDCSSQLLKYLLTDCTPYGKVLMG